MDKPDTVDISNKRKARLLGWSAGLPSSELNSGGMLSTVILHRVDEDAFSFTSLLTRIKHFHEEVLMF